MQLDDQLLDVGVLDLPPCEVIVGRVDEIWTPGEEFLTVRGLSSSPALHGSNFYTITYEVGETGEKHTVQVKMDQTVRIIIIMLNRFQ